MIAADPTVFGAEGASDRSAGPAGPPSGPRRERGTSSAASVSDAAASFVAMRAAFRAARGPALCVNASGRDAAPVLDDAASETDAAAVTVAGAVLVTAAVCKTSADDSGADFATLRCSSASFKIIKPRMMTCGLARPDSAMLQHHKSYIDPFLASTGGVMAIA